MEKNLTEKLSKEINVTNSISSLQRGLSGEADGQTLRKHLKHDSFQTTLTLPPATPMSTIQVQCSMARSCSNCLEDYGQIMTPGLGKHHHPSIPPQKKNPLLKKPDIDFTYAKFQAPSQWYLSCSWGSMRNNSNLILRKQTETSNFCLSEHLFLPTAYQFPVSPW